MVTYIVNDNRFWENGYGILDDGQDSDREKKGTIAEYRMCTSKEQ